MNKNSLVHLIHIKNQPNKRQQQKNFFLTTEIQPINIEGIIKLEKKISIWQDLSIDAKINMWTFKKHHIISIASKYYQTRYLLITKENTVTLLWWHLPDTTLSKWSKLRPPRMENDLCASRDDILRIHHSCYLLAKACSLNPFIRKSISQTNNGQSTK